MIFVFRNKIKTDLINTWELSHSLVQEILLSNEIEGVVSTRKEINELLDMKSPKEYRRLYGMVNKYRDIFFQKAAFDPITDSSKLRKVYKLLRQNEFRWIQLEGGGYRISKKSFDEWLDKGNASVTS